VPVRRCSESRANPAAKGARTTRLTITLTVMLALEAHSACAVGPGNASEPCTNDMNDADAALIEATQARTVRRPNGRVPLHPLFTRQAIGLCPDTLSDNCEG
jgi:hypothetical protein